MKVFRGLVIMFIYNFKYTIVMLVVTSDDL